MAKEKSGSLITEQINQKPSITGSPHPNSLLLGKHAMSPPAARGACQGQEGGRGQERVPGLPGPSSGPPALPRFGKNTPAPPAATDRRS